MSWTQEEMDKEVCCLIVHLEAISALFRDSESIAGEKILKALESAAKTDQFPEEAAEKIAEAASVEDVASFRQRLDTAYHSLIEEIDNYRNTVDLAARTMFWLRVTLEAVANEE